MPRKITIVEKTSQPQEPQLLVKTVITPTTFNFKQVLLSLLVGIVLAGLFSFGFYAFADPPASEYTLGETLNPSCAPGSTNCTVTPPVPYTGATSAVDLGSQNFSTTGTGSFGALSATGITSSGTITFSNLSTNGGVLYTDASGDLEQTVVGSAGQVLTSNGTGLAPTWQNAGGAGANPGGSTTELQYNNGGSFGGIAGVTADGVGLTSIGVDLTGSTTGDTYYLSGGKLNRLPIASTNDFLTVASGLPAWSTNSFSIQGDTSFTGAYPFAATLTGSTNVTFPTSGTLVNTSVTSLPSLTGVSTLTSGGATSGFLLGNVTTDLGSDATGDIYYRNSSGNLARLSPGSSNQVLTVSGGLPSWQNVPGAALTVGTSTITSGTNTYIEYNNNGVLGEYPITGSGNVVLSTSPTLVTPTLGAASATSINGLAITSSTGTLTIGNGKTLTASDSATLATNAITLGGGEVVTFTASNPLTLTTTGSTNVTFPTSGTLVNTSVTSLPSLTGVSTLTSGGATSGFLLGNVTTDLGSDATGDIYYRNSSGNLARLSPGSSNQVLTVSGGLPSWQNVPGAALTVGTSTITSGTNTYIEYNNNGVLGEYPITGSGNVVLSTSPTLVTPTLGAASATSINGLAITSSTGTLTIGNGKTLTASDSATLATNAITLGGGEVVTFTASNPLTLTTTGSTNVTFPTSGTLLTTTGSGTGLSGIPTSVSNSDGTLTISPTTGSVIASLNLSNNNIWSATETVSSSSASAFAVGRNGATNPGLNVDDSTASAGTGLDIISKAAASGLGLSVIGPSTNEGISINTKGSGGFNIQQSGTGSVNIGVATLITSSSANAFVVGPNGATNPTLQISDNTGSQATGINITGAAAGGGVAMSAISSGSNEPFSLNALGTGNLTLQNVGTGNLLIDTSTNISAVGTGIFTVGNNGTTTPILTVNGGVANEVNGFTVNGGPTSSGPTIAATGSDANILFHLNPKGNSLLDFNNNPFSGTSSAPIRVEIAGGAANTSTSGTDTDLLLNENFDPTSTSTMNAIGININPTINYSNGTPGAGSYTALLIDPIETALPTGINYLIKANAGSAGTTTKFSVDNSGNIGSATWQGNVITGTYGGTGVNNGSSTITLGGNINTANSLTTSGNNPLTLTTTGSTTVTFPTSGTLVNTSVASLPSLTGVSTLSSGGATSGFLLGNVTTDLGSDATGDIYYRNSSGNLARLGVGSSNQVLTVSGGLPSWQNAGGGSGLTIGTTTITSGTNTYVEYNNNGTLGEYPITGSGNVVLSTSPSLVTPTLGVASATSLTAANIYGGSGVSSTLTLSGTSNGSPSNAYVILNGSGQGNVGIGTTTPGAALEVVGNIISKGTSWSLQTAPNDSFWQGITYGNGLFVAVAASTGVSDDIMTSPDGINWTLRTAPNNSHWNSVTYGNGLFVAVASSSGSSDDIMTSPNGITWTLRTAPNNSAWTSVTYGNGLFVAVAAGSGVSDDIMTSPDGITWSLQTAPHDSYWQGVTYGNGLFVAVARGNGTAAQEVMTSSNGTSWSLATASAAVSWYAITYGNGLFVAVDESNGDIMTSSNGTSWTSRSNPAAGGGSGGTYWQGVTYGNGLFVTVDDEEGVTYDIMTSPDGINWTLRTVPYDSNFSSITYGNGLFVTVAASSGASHDIMTSSKEELNAPSNNNQYNGGLTLYGQNSTGTTTSSDFNFNSNALTTGTSIYGSSSSVTTGKLFDLATTGNTWTGNGITNGLVNLTSTSTDGAASASNILFDLARSGTNINSSVTSYGQYTSVTNTGTTSTNVAEYLNASGATNNYGLIVNAGNVGINTASPGGLLSVAGTNVSGTTTSSDFNVTSSNLTSGSLAYVNSSSVTTGKLFDLATTGTTWTGNGIASGLVDLTSTSTAGTASASNILLDLARSGANTNSSVTTYGDYNSVTNTGTTSTNVAEYLNASGATNNYALIDNSGYVGINTSSPGGLLSIAGSNTTGSTTSSDLNVTSSNLTSGTLEYLASSSITTGQLISITTGNTWAGNGTTSGLVNIVSGSTGGVASGSDIMLNIFRSGVNANTNHIAYGIYDEVVNTNATSGNNIAAVLYAAGATSSNIALSVPQGSIQIPTSNANFSNSGTGDDFLCYNLASGFVSYGANCTASSERFKNNINPLPEGGLDEVLALQPVSFYYDQGYGDNGAAEQVGFIAEQAVKVDPRLVPLDPSGQPGGFNYQNYTAILTKAIQEQQVMLGNFTADSDGTFISGVQAETPLDPITTVTNQLANGGKILENLVVARVTAIKGYFDEIFANKVHTSEICITKSDGTELCINGDQLQNIVNGTNSGSSNDSNGTSPGSTTSSSSGSSGSSGSGSSSSSSSSTPSTTPSSADSITAFTFGLSNETDTITSTAISITVPSGTDVTTLTPTIALSDGATVSPNSNISQDFTNPVTYTVTAQDGVTTQQYAVTVTVASATTSSSSDASGSDTSTSGTGTSGTVSSGPDNSGSTGASSDSGDSSSSSSSDSSDATGGGGN